MSRKPHPESSPHYSGSNEEASKPQGRSKEPTGKRRGMSGPGFFFDPTPPEAPQAQETKVTNTPTSEDEKPRMIRFKEGTRLYAVMHDKKTGKIVIPYNDAEAGALLRNRLPQEADLEIDRKEGMTIGKRGKPVINNVGTSSIGAFTVVRLPIGIAEREVITEERLVDLNDRALSRDNPRLKFKDANSPVPPHLRRRAK